MGMSSECSLLMLTSRKNTIGRNLESLSLQKNSLSRDMKRVTKEYQEALNTKVLKWSNNSGVDYVDLSYKNLMTPSNANQNTPYLITDSNGKVVIDSKYEDYAKMIDENGGKYDDNVRAKILSGLISDVSESDITNADSTSAAKTAAQEKYDALLAAEPQKSKYNAEEKGDAEEIAGLCGTFSTTSGSTTTEYDLQKLYSSSSGTIDLGDSSSAYSTLQNLTNMIADNMSRYLDGTDETLFKNECTNFCEQNKYLFGTDESSKKTAENGASGGIKLTGENYTVNIREMFDSILENYKDNGGSYIQNSNSTGNNGIAYTYSDKESDEYKNWKADHDTWETDCAAAKAEVKSATDTDNQALTSEQEQKINFYDQLFNAIADNGWTSDSQVSDNDYLNNMMQNGLYYITTMSEEEAQNTDGTTSEYYEYTSTPASNFDLVFSVNDSDAQEEAQVNYEYEKSVISEKETRLDTRMQDLETEQSAINEMIKTAQNIIKDNVGRTFSIFS